MGNRILGSDIAGKINKALGKKLLGGTLTQKTAGTRTAGRLTAGTNPTDGVSNFRGMFDNLSERAKDSTRITARGEAVFMLGDSLPTGVVPGVGDTILLEGRTVLVVRLVERDPDAAGYLVEVKG